MGLRGGSEAWHMEKVGGGWGVPTLGMAQLQGGEILSERWARTGVNV